MKKRAAAQKTTQTAEQIAEQMAEELDQREKQLAQVKADAEARERRVANPEGVHFLDPGTFSFLGGYGGIFEIKRLLLASE